MSLLYFKRNEGCRLLQGSVWTGVRDTLIVAPGNSYVAGTTASVPSWLTKLRSEPLAAWAQVQRSKNRWKCVLKSGVMHINGRDVLFKTCQGEMNF